MEVDPRGKQSAVVVRGGKSQPAIGDFSGSLIIAQTKGSEPGSEEDIIILRIQLRRPLQIADRIIPTSLSPVDIPAQFEEMSIVWHGAPRDRQLLPGPLIVEVAKIIMQSQGKVGVARIRLEPEGGVDGRLRRLQTACRAIETRPIDAVMGPGQLTICKKKTGIPRNRLIQKFHSLEKIRLTAETVIDGFLDQRKSANVKLVGDQVPGRPFLDGQLLGKRNARSESIRC